MNIGIDIIHKIHMQISYDQDHNIYRYVENIINSSCFKFDRKNIITINRFKRFDTGLQIINGHIDLLRFDANILSNNEKILLLFNKCNKDHLKKQIENDNKKMSKAFADDSLKFIHEMINEYECTKNIGFIKTIEWIINKYLAINVSAPSRFLIDTNKIIIMIYVLGLIEWFHIMIFNYNFNSLESLNKMILCEIFDIELDLLLDYDIDNLKEFLKNEYCSHSVVYIFDNKNMYVFDPDLSISKKDDENLMNSYDRLCHILNRKNKSLDIVLKNPIQTLIDDNYCIFHCIEFMLNFATFNKIKDIKRFMKYVEKQNKIKTLIDVHEYILELNKKANIFVESHKCNPTSVIHPISVMN